MPDPASPHIPQLPVLHVRGLSVDLATASGHWRPILSGVSFAIDPGSITGLLGESGAGKTTLALSLLGLLGKAYRSTGSIDFPSSGRASLIFQDPLLALNPVLTVRRQIEEVIRAHGHSDAVTSLLELAGLPATPRILNAYPHQLSGGERQRVTIAQALASKPELIVADEPFTALDVIRIAELAALFRDLKHKTGSSFLLISHSPGVLAAVADSVMVMQQGRIVEQGPPDTVLRATMALPLPHGRGSVTLSSRDCEGAVTPFLRVDHVSKTYPHPLTTVLQDVSLSLEKGRVLGIVGRSGSGKSTLARCLARQETPTAGSIHLEGTVQLILQQPASSLNPRFTAAEIVAEPLAIAHRASAAERRAASEHSMEAVGLPASSSAKPALQFSGGERQRLAIARALAIEPQLLILDESFSGLDRVLQIQLAHLLFDLQHRLGLTMILISHDLTLVAHLADEVAVMHAGAIVEHGPAAQILSNPSHPVTRELRAASVEFAERA